MLSLEKTRLKEYITAAFCYRMGAVEKTESLVRDVQKKIKHNEQKLQQVKFWK